MKAVLVTNLPSSYRRDLFDALGDEQRVQWTVFFAQPSLRPDQQREYPTRIPWTIAKHGRVASTLAMLVRSSPDAIVVGGSGLQAAVCVAYSQAAGVPLGIWWGGTRESERRLGLVRSFLRRFLFARAAYFLCYAPESAVYLDQLGVAPQRLQVLGNATLDIDSFAAAAAEARARREQLRAELGLESPVVLSVGRLKPSKNQERLVAAFLQMRDRVGGGSLVLIGDGPDRDRLEHPNVTILPKVSWRRMPEMYGVSDIYAHPSLVDLWPQAVSEALASQTPVIVSAQSGFAAFLEDGRQALVVDGQSSQEIATALVRLAEDVGLRADLGMAGRDAVAPLGADNLATRMTDVVMRHAVHVRASCDGG